MDQIIAHKDYNSVKPYLEKFKKAKDIDNDDQLAVELTKQIFTEQVKLPIYVDLQESKKQNSERFDQYIQLIEAKYVLHDKGEKQKNFAEMNSLMMQDEIQVYESNGEIMPNQVNKTMDSRVDVEQINSEIYDKQLSIDIPVSRQ